MATRRQREAAAPRPAANSGPRNQTAASAAAAACSTASASAAAAARSGSRNPTAATVAASSRPRNQTTIAAANGRPHPRNRRALGDIGNRVNAAVVVDGVANRRPFTRSLSTQPNAAATDENTIAPAHLATAVDGVSRAVSGKNKEEDNTKVTRAEMDAIVDSFMKAVVKYEAIATKAIQSMERSVSLAQGYERLADQLQKRYEEIVGDNRRLVAETNQLECQRAQKEAQVRQLMGEVRQLMGENVKVMGDNVKVMQENVRLHALLDKKEAQLQAMSEQCKFMALNHHN